jgi:hypothetical protein
VGLRNVARVSISQIPVDGRKMTMTDERTQDLLWLAMKYKQGDESDKAVSGIIYILLDALQKNAEKDMVGFNIQLALDNYGRDFDNNSHRFIKE